MQILIKIRFSIRNWKIVVFLLRTDTIIIVGSMFSFSHTGHSLQFSVRAVNNARDLFDHGILVMLSMGHLSFRNHLAELLNQEILSFVSITLM